MEYGNFSDSSTSLTDYGEYFVTDQIFPTRDDLIMWAREVAQNIGFVVVVMRSDGGGSGLNKKRREFLTLGCERSGRYQKYVSQSEHKRETGTKKLECPFRLRGRPHAKEGWKLTVTCGKHNHPRAETLVGHPYPGRLKLEERKIVEDMTKSNVKPSKILHTLKERDPENVSTIKGIYNARAAYTKFVRGPRTEMQQLMLMLESHGYHHRHRKEDGSDVVKDIFWAYKESIRLFHTFPSVVIIDVTYKTSRYALPLLEIVGVTSTNLTFAIAFAYMESERSDNYIWALQMLKDLIVHDDGFPKVIVSDRDMALLNALKVIFPDVKHLLCQYHIEKCVQAKCKLLVPKRDLWNKVFDAWNLIVDSATEEAYQLSVDALQTLCKAHKEFVIYCQTTWLTPHKECFVHAWIDKVMHLGNTTTNRVEGHHAKLKKLLVDSQGDFCKVWDRMHELVAFQITATMASFQQSTVVTEHRFNFALYNKLRGVVSRHCLQEIHDERKRSMDIGTDKSKCGCVIRATHGIPCACQIANIESTYRVIPLDEIHVHWRRLAIREDHEPQGEPSDEMSAMRVAVDGLWERFLGLDLAGRQATVLQVNELGHPEGTSMHPPMHKVKKKESFSRKGWQKAKSNKRDPSYFEVVDSQVDSNTSDNEAMKGKRHKSLKYADDLPPGYLPFIDEVINVLADGNCGYRVISRQVYSSEGEWPLIRMHCYQQMVSNAHLYIEMFGTETYAKLLASTTVDQMDGFQPLDKWMTFPDMGYVIASIYQRPVVYVSKIGSCTFFPLTGTPAKVELIGIAYVSGCHFVQVNLKKNCPLPPIALQWSRYCDVQASSWKDWMARRNLSYSHPTQRVPRSI